MSTLSIRYHFNDPIYKTTLYLQLYSHKVEHHQSYMLEGYNHQMRDNTLLLILL